MLVDELGMSIPPKKNGKIVKPRDDTLQFDTVHKEYRYRRLVLSHVVQENILNVLRFLVGHGSDPSFIDLLMQARRVVARPSAEN